ncbi:hypothetical protein MHK_005437 [Candidatus Magnetomorum sp. HK-1]|nr:hypothetical protein MHK_005437 [Candidatus Magnetomorum sp. HK-1]
MQKVYSQIIQIAGDVITVEADDVGYKELAEVKTSLGTSLAQVIKLDGKKVSFQLSYQCFLAISLIYFLFSNFTNTNSICLLIS